MVKTVTRCKLNFNFVRGKPRKQASEFSTNFSFISVEKC